MVRSMRPMSRIMARLRAALVLRGGAALIHGHAHALDGTVEAAEDRLADEEMADIELDDGGNGGDRPDRLVAEAVPGMAFEADRLGMRSGGDDPLQLPLARSTRCVAISAGMQLDDRRAQMLRHVELALLGVDEERDTDAARDEPPNDRRQMLLEIGRASCRERV